MIWTLSRAQLACGARRAGDAFSAQPVVVGLVGLLAASLPALALWGGARAASSLRDAVADASVAHAVAVSLSLSAALAGAVVTVAAPSADALGNQLAAAPLTRRDRFAGLTLIPAAVALTLPFASVALALAPVARGAVPAAGAALVAAAALGGALVEASFALARRRVRGVLVLTVCTVIAVLDPTRALAASLRGSTRASSFVLAAAAAAVWIGAAAFRPERGETTRDVRVVARGVLGSAVARYARTRELRAHAWSAVAAAGGGAVLLRATGVTAAPALLLAGATGIVGASTFVLAGAGIDRRARWLWRVAPRDPALLAALFAVAALALSLLVATCAVAVAFAAAPVAPVRVVPLVALAAACFGAAFVAGALVPWRSRRAVDQLATFATFAAVGAASSTGAAALAPLLRADAGVRGAVLALATLAAGLGVSSLAAAR